MDDAPKDGGPAYPVPEQHGQQRNNDYEWEEGWREAHPGMSLRDKFAEAVVNGLWANMAEKVLTELSEKSSEQATKLIRDFSRLAYAQADAMLATRKDP